MLVVRSQIRGVELASNVDQILVQTVDDQPYFLSHNNSAANPYGTLIQ